MILGIAEIFGHSGLLYWLIAAHCLPKVVIYLQGLELTELKDGTWLLRDAIVIS